jgi:NAD(P)H-hydrate epimerase
MQPILSREQMRALDALAIEGGIASLSLMENAGRGAAYFLQKELPPGARVLIICGRGNNGGDGFVVARVLRRARFDVQVVLLGKAQELRGEAEDNYQAWVGLGQDVISIVDEAGFERFSVALDWAHVVVDALFGTGLDRPLSELALGLVQRLNTATMPTARLSLGQGRRIPRVVSLDLPSGLDADHGTVLGAAVRADATITFAFPKAGLLTPSGAEHSGRLFTVDVGIPPDLVQQTGMVARGLQLRDVSELCPERSVAAHKGQTGRVIVIAGSLGKLGAALLSTRGALRGGAGLVTIATFPETRAKLDRRVLEVMTRSIDENNLAEDARSLFGAAHALVIGPGLGLDARARELTEVVVREAPGPVIIDADALSHLAGRPEWLASAAGPRLLTPHSAEMGRLLGIDASAVEEDRIKAAQELAERAQAYVILKGAHTIVAAPGELPWINLRGTPALATAGSGDVLSGLLGALAAERELHAAALLGVWLHARSGVLWAERSGTDRGLLAREIADGIVGAFSELLSPGHHERH